MRALADDLRPADLAQSQQHQAYGFLKSLPREWSGTSNRDCKTYEDKNIEGLTPSFARSAAVFLAAFVEVHGEVTITSGFRSAQEQSCVCEGEKGPCAGRPRTVRGKKGRRITKRSTSRHQYGIALDVRAGTGSKEEFLCLHEFAQFNPQFGVHFPLGERDQPHLEPLPEADKRVRVAGLRARAPGVIPCNALKRMHSDTPVD
jgi:hypothetical protein